jgi:hypothetical protein
MNWSIASSLTSSHDEQRCSTVPGCHRAHKKFNSRPVAPTLKSDRKGTGWVRIGAFLPAGCTGAAVSSSAAPRIRPAAQTVAPKRASVILVSYFDKESFGPPFPQCLAQPRPHYPRLYAALRLTPTSPLNSRTRIVGQVARPRWKSSIAVLSPRLRNSNKAFGALDEGLSASIRGVLAHVESSSITRRIRQRLFRPSPQPVVAIDPDEVQTLDLDGSIRPQA